MILVGSASAVISYIGHKFMRVLLHEDMTKGIALVISSVPRFSLWLVLAMQYLRALHLQPNIRVVLEHPIS